MAVAVLCTQKVPAGYTALPKITVQFRLLREGEVTTGEKFLRLYRGFDNLAQLSMVFWAEAGTGEFTQTYTLDLAETNAQGDWLAIGTDDAPPRKIRAIYLPLADSGTRTYNITTGEGGNTGNPATLGSRVRVDGQPANREVVVLEKPSDGEWRIAGFGVTPGGAGTIDVRITDGILYAVGLDDWGMGFAASLAVTVGQTIRPSQYTGWLYRITEAGTLPATEPEWWAAEGDNPSRLLGTARAIAVRYYQPLAHGPVPVEIT